MSQKERERMADVMEWAAKMVNEGYWVDVSWGGKLRTCQATIGRVGKSASFCTRSGGTELAARLALMNVYYEEHGAADDFDARWAAFVEETVDIRIASLTVDHSLQSFWVQFVANHYEFTTYGETEGDAKISAMQMWAKLTADEGEPVADRVADIDRRLEVLNADLVAVSEEFAILKDEVSDG